MGNSWQSPVAGEPSLGTPHKHIAVLYAADPAVTTVITVDCTAWMPVGTTWLDYILGVASTTVGDYVTITDAAGTAIYDYNQVQVAANTIYIAGGCPIDSARCVYFKVNNARVTAVEIRSKKYFT
jgi:hypothetical protein